MIRNKPLPILVLLLGLTGAGVSAQPAPADPNAAEAQQGISTAAERSQQRRQISAERQRQDELFRAAESACYQRFAVTDCLHAARVQRRAVLDELRRREVILNDLDRQAQAQATLRRIGQKVDADAQP